ncbi:hypothetical protein KAU08_02185, partial [bacterium]|nr:hypothetical protein [bacterium]
MRKSNVFALTIFGLALLFVMSCSGNSTTQPPVNPDADDFFRSLEGNGDSNGGNNGGGGWGWPGPDPDFEADCIRDFNVDYVFELPSEKTFEKS